MTNPRYFLEGIMVLDCTGLLPGAVASLYLADMGAEVIKIEQPGVGDYARGLGAEPGEDGALFRMTNRNKKSVTLNLKTEKGRRIFMELAAQADVILEGYRPGVADALGINYEVCRSVNHLLIYASLTGWGQSGPYASLAGHDLNYLSVAGLIALSTSSDGEPVVPGTQMADLNGSVHAAITILGALYGRQMTGEGVYLDVAMLDGVLTWEVVAASEQFSSGKAVDPRGHHALTGGVISYNIYLTKDGRYVSLGAVELKFWRAFCEAVGRTEWVERQMAPADRRGFHRELIELFESKTLAEWTKLGVRADCCLSPVLKMEEVWDHPQVKSREITTEWGAEDAERTVGFRFPVRMSGSYPGAMQGKDMVSAPRLGEHNVEVFGRIGLSQKELARMTSEGVV